MLLWIVFAVLGAPLTLILHELSHAVTIWTLGGSVTSFWPIPGKSMGRHYFPLGIGAPEDSHWRLGYATWEFRGGRPANYAWTSIAPLFKSLVLGVVWGALSWFVYAPLAMFAIWEGLDAGNWLRTYFFSSNPRHDAYKWRHRDA